MRLLIQLAFWIMILVGFILYVPDVEHAFWQSTAQPSLWRIVAPRTDPFSFESYELRSVLQLGRDWLA